MTRRTMSDEEHQAFLAQLKNPTTENPCEIPQCRYDALRQWPFVFQRVKQLIAEKRCIIVSDETRFISA